MEDTHTTTERAHSLVDPVELAAVVDPELRAVLRAYLRDGRMASFPRTGKKRTLLLGYLATAFEPGVKYTEPEVNETCATWHPDTAALRRYLVDEGLLSRKDGLYWRSGGWL